MSYERSDPVRPAMIASAVALPLLYVFSSGPMQTVAFRRHTTHTTDGFGRTTAISEIDQGTWWPKVYAPLDWASEQSWGKPVNRYWKLFPIRSTRELP